MSNKVLLTDIPAIIKILGHSKLGSPEAEQNHLAAINIAARNAALKGTNSNQTSVVVQRDISQNDNLEKLAQRANSWSQKRKNKIRNSTTVGSIKEKALVWTKEQHRHMGD